MQGFSTHTQTLKVMGVFGYCVRTQSFDAKLYCKMWRYYVTSISSMCLECSVNHKVRFKFLS